MFAIWHPAPDQARLAPLAMDISMFSLKPRSSDNRSDRFVAMLQDATDYLSTWAQTYSDKGQATHANDEVGSMRMGISQISIESQRFIWGIRRCRWIPGIVMGHSDVAFDIGLTDSSSFLLSPPS